jgi:hypothetical protein
MNSASSTTTSMPSAQAVGDRDAGLARDGDLRHAEALACAQRELDLRLVPAQPTSDQLVHAERIGVDDLDVRGDLRDAVGFEYGDHHHSPPVELQVGERVDDRERHLVAQRRGADAVRVDENGVHGASRRRA